MTMPISGWLVIHRLGLAMINLSTKLKSIYPPVEKKVENDVVLGS